MVPGALSIALATGLALAPGPEEPPKPGVIELEWDAPATCPSTEDIRARYQALLSHPAVGQGTMLAEGRVTHSGDVWRLDLVTTFEGVRDPRVLEAGSCDELGDAAATVFAIVLEPTLFDEDEPPASIAEPVVPTPELSAPEPSAPEPSERAEPSPPPLLQLSELEPAPLEPRPDSSPRRPRAAPRVGGLLRPQVGIESGALPGVAAWVGLAAGLAWPRVRVELDGAWLSPRQAAGPRGSRFRTQNFLVGVRGCWRFWAGHVEFPQCAGLEAGAVYAVASGVPGSEVVVGPWVAPSLRTAVARRWGRWGLFVGVGAAPRLHATRLRIDRQAVFTPRFVSLRGLVGLEIFFDGRGS